MVSRWIRSTLVRGRGKRFAPVAGDADIDLVAIDGEILDDHDGDLDRPDKPVGRLDHIGLRNEYSAKCRQNHQRQNHPLVELHIVSLLIPRTRYSNAD